MIAHDARPFHPGQVGARPGGVLEMLESSGRHAARALALQSRLQQEAEAEASEPELEAELRRIVHDRLLWSSSAAAAAPAATTLRLGAPRGAAWGGEDDEGGVGGVGAAMLLTAEAGEQAKLALTDRSALLRFVLRQLPAAGLEEVCRAQLGTAAIEADAVEEFELRQLDVAATLAVAAEHAAHGAAHVHAGAEHGEDAVPYALTSQSSRTQPAAPRCRAPSMAPNDLLPSWGQRAARFLSPHATSYDEQPPSLGARGSSASCGANGSHSSAGLASPRAPAGTPRGTPGGSLPPLPVPLAVLHPPLEHDYTLPDELLAAAAYEALLLCTLSRREGAPTPHGAEEDTLQAVRARLGLTLRQHKRLLPWLRAPRYAGDDSGGAPPPSSPAYRGALLLHVTPEPSEQPRTAERRDRDLRELRALCERQVRCTVLRWHGAEMHARALLHAGALLRAACCSAAWGAVWGVVWCALRGARCTTVHHVACSAAPAGGAAAQLRRARARCAGRALRESGVRPAAGAGGPPAAAALCGGRRGGRGGGRRGDARRGGGAAWHGAGGVRGPAGTVASRPRLPALLQPARGGL